MLCTEISKTISTLFDPKHSILPACRSLSPRRQHCYLSGNKDWCRSRRCGLKQEEVRGEISAHLALNAVLNVLTLRTNGTSKTYLCLQPSKSHSTKGLHGCMSYFISRGSAYNIPKFIGSTVKNEYQVQFDFRSNLSCHEDRRDCRNSIRYRGSFVRWSRGVRHRAFASS